MKKYTFAILLFAVSYSSFPGDKTGNVAEIAIELKEATPAEQRDYCSDLIKRQQMCEHLILTADHDTSLFRACCWD